MAPPWSWASVDRVVVWKRLPEALKAETIHRSELAKTLQTIEVIHAEVDGIGDGNMGQVTGGFLILQAMTASIVLTRKTQIPEWHRVSFGVSEYELVGVNFDSLATADLRAKSDKADLGHMILPIAISEGVLWGATSDQSRRRHRQTTLQ